MQGNQTIGMVREGSEKWAKNSLIVSLKFNYNYR